MRILNPTAYYEPEQVSSSHIAKNRNDAFINAGFDLRIVTPTPSRGLDDNTIKEYAKRNKEVLEGGHITVYRIPLFKEKGNSLFRTLRYVIGGIKQLRFCVKNGKDCDVILAASTPPFMGALCGRMKKKLGIPFIYNLQDIFPDSLVGTGLSKKNSILWKIGRKIEDYTYLQADKIIVISQDFKRNIMAKGVPEEKIEVIYNWVDQNAVVDIPRQENKLFDKYSLDRSKFYVTYNGNIGLTQNMDMLLEVAKALEANEDIHFVLVGNGAYLEEVKSIIAERGIGNVTLLPFQPYEDISHVFSLGDVSLVISKSGVGENSVPSKTWSIMSASRPVLANFDENELKTIIEDHHCGIFTKAGDKVAFTDAILKLYHDRELCKELGRNGRQFVLDNLTKEVGTQKYVDVIKSFEKK